MTRIIDCDGCGAHYFLDESLLRGAKGARIRCRKCGGPIEIRQFEEMPRQEPEPAPPPAAEPEPVPAQVEPSPDAVFDDVRRLYMDRVTQVPFPAPQAPPERKRRFLVPLLLGVAALLGIGLAAVYFLRPELLPLKALKAPPAPPSAASVAAGTPSYEARDAAGEPWQLSSGEQFFVVNGVVTNVGDGMSNGILLRAVLRGEDNAVIAEGQAFAGNPIVKEWLPRMTRAAIEERLARRSGEADMNRRIPPGGSLPYTIVIFGSLGPVTSISVEATDAPMPAPAP